jgi:hypothetical protein
MIDGRSLECVRMVMACVGSERGVFKCVPTASCDKRSDGQWRVVDLTMGSMCRWNVSGVYRSVVFRVLSHLFIAIL